MNMGKRMGTSSINGGRNGKTIELDGHLNHRTLGGDFPAFSGLINRGHYDISPW